VAVVAALPFLEKPIRPKASFPAEIQLADSRDDARDH
jgi:hypothetical protein